ncbi:serine hydrolase [Caenimonas sedimenti]|uniref:Serine hydrolase n=1 Tax=Caenimonas sedimenti TaxID=2596921 RepID=A0A562ZQE7_9BURK|nr:serine hydrolase [Caenimonas sedimenti]TWO70394.1 serine hydrolase [Caenimonas sedimenti]
MDATDTLEFDGKRYLGGPASDPNVLGWMQGTPPAAERRVTFAGDRFFAFPEIRWSLSHMRELVPTANVWRGETAASPLGQPSPADAAAIDALPFTDMNGQPRRWDAALHDTYTDGIVVLHRGKRIYERYFGALQAHVPHSCFSITKSYACTLAAALVHEGVLDETRLVPHYLPEMQGTAYANATLRQVMDMQIGVAYSELYSDPKAQIWDYSRAGGLRPRPAGYSGAQNFYEYLQTLRPEGEHGQAFAYKTVNTELLCWVMKRVTGVALADMLSQRIWAPLGCEQDGYLTVDPIGVPMGGGGLNAALRDMARFGELMRCDGAWGGRQLLPAAVVADIRGGADPAKFAKAGYTLLPGYSYRSMWWVTHNEHGAFEGRGIHGQRLYVAPKAELVVARFASHPVAASAANDPLTLPALLALGRMLGAA